MCDLGSKMNEDVSIELANYQSKDGIFSKKFIWDNMQDRNPLQFWKMLYNITPLSKIALKILSAPCTSAATERIFSTFSWIHNKRRNRLTTERAGKLTYLSYNWKIKYCEPKSKYSNTMHSVSDNEDSMSVRAETNEVVSSDGGSIISESDTETESEILYADSDSCEEEKSSSSESGM